MLCVNSVAFPVFTVYKYDINTFKINTPASILMKPLMFPPPPLSNTQLSVWCFPIRSDIGNSANDSERDIKSGEITGCYEFHEALINTLDSALAKL